MKEHNYDGEQKDFNKLKTKSSISKNPVQNTSQNYYKLQGSEDKTLIFESKFESGNLLAAVKQSDTEYDLILQNDINTNGHT